jgi:hypothetical protein
MGFRCYHDRNIKERSIGDLVLHRIQKTDGLHKLNSPWEGHVGVLTWQLTKGSTQGRRLWPRRDRELEGETRGTQFRQVWAVRCVIPYVLYVA